MIEYLIYLPPLLHTYLVCNKNSTLNKCCQYLFLTFTLQDTLQAMLQVILSGNFYTFLYYGVKLTVTAPIILFSVESVVSASYLPVAS